MMNSDWSSNMGDAFAPLGGEDDGLIELLWCNGHVVMQSQAPGKPPLRPEKAPAMQEDHEAAPWFQYPVVDDEESLEKDLFSEIFGGTPPDAGRECKEEEHGAAVTALRSGLMPPPPRPEKAGWGNDVSDNYARAASEGVVAATDAGESSSVLTIGSRSICGSNHVQAPCAARARVIVSDTTAGDSAPPPPLRDGTSSIPARSSHHDASTTVTSSSMPSRPPGAASRKRKQSDSMDQPESLSVDVEYQSAAATREPVQKLTTAKRRRAAEVHNLSERRRRDRINEKMKALQELIPHCNKTDKASMLDEAIEYLKSLQRQVQMMWMGGGMAAAAAPAPVMFPAGVHQYMQRMASMPRMPPFMPAAQSSPVIHLPAVDSYARCLAVEHLQPPPSPMGMMNFYQLGAAKNLQQNTPPPPPPVVPGGSLPATAVAPPPDNALHRNYGVKL